jgi:hypothetical protein
VYQVFDSNSSEINKIRNPGKRKFHRELSLIVIPDVFCAGVSVSYLKNQHPAA